MNIPEQIQYLNKFAETKANKQSEYIHKRIASLGKDIQKLDNWVNHPNGHDLVRMRFEPIMKNYWHDLACLKVKFFA